MGSLSIFYLLAGLALFCSVMVITLRNAVTSAVFLIADLFVLAAIYAHLGADFIAGIQVLVYAGAILVLFLFVIMMLNQGRSSAVEDESRLGGFDKLVSSLVAAIVVIFVATAARTMRPSSEGAAVTVPAAQGDNTFELGMHLFSKYLWPFELASLLILLAIIASILIAKKKSH